MTALFRAVTYLRDKGEGGCGCGGGGRGGRGVRGEGQVYHTLSDNRGTLRNTQGRLVGVHVGDW